MPSTSTSTQATSQTERYGLIAEVHFTINRNKKGWYITECNSGGAPYRTHGPLEGPLTPMEALSFLTANQTLNQ